MNSIPSPFTNRGVITSSEDFFGRKIEINEILTRLRTMQSTSVVGERRIGKSSLLYHLYQTGVRRLDNDTRFRFLYLDLQDARYHTARSGQAWWRLDSGRAMRRIPSNCRAMPS